MSYNQVKFNGEVIKKPYCDNSKRWIEIKPPDRCPHIKPLSNGKCIIEKCEYYTLKVINKYYIDTMRYGDQYKYKAKHYETYRKKHCKNSINNKEVNKEYNVCIKEHLSKDTDVRF